MNKTTEKIPTWSLGYIINGDATGLTDEEIRMIDEWQSKWNVQIVSPITDEEGRLFHPSRTRKAAHTLTFHITLFSACPPKSRIAKYFTRMTTSKK